MIEPRYANLQKLFADRVFRIPAYQRFYSWQPRQRTELFSDLNKLASAEPDQHHFMATIVCNRTGETKSIGTSEYNLYDVVDGQQRLTTLIILLKTIEIALPSDSEDRKDLGSILVKRDGHLILLQTNNVNADLFNTFIREGVNPGKKELKLKSDLNIVSAIVECARFVQEWQTQRKLTELMRLVLHRLGFVVYDTADARSVYTLFEVLNSRGLAVDWLDKTKSTLMGRTFELSPSNTAAQAGIEDLQKLWGNIYAELAEEDISGDEVLVMTATLYYGLEQGKPRSADASLEVIRDACDVQGSPEKITKRILTVSRFLTRLYAQSQLQAVTKILHARLLAVALYLADGVTEAERALLFEQWERVTFRIFGLLNKDSRTKVGDYTRLASRIVRGDTAVQSFNQIMAQLKGLGAEYPVEAAVNEGLRSNDIYNQSPEVCRYILWNYEESLAQKLGSAATFDEHERSSIWKLRASESLEHIYPQVPSAGWPVRRSSDSASRKLEAQVHRIGNLLLLPMQLNGQAQAKPFADKKNLYKAHHLRMLTSVCILEKWDFTCIQAREDEIASWALRRWADI
jgi:hypothetical protein